VTGDDMEHKEKSAADAPLLTEMQTALLATWDIARHPLSVDRFDASWRIAWGYLFGCILVASLLPYLLKSFVHVHGGLMQSPGPLGFPLQIELDVGEHWEAEVLVMLLIAMAVSIALNLIFSFFAWMVSYFTRALSRVTFSTALNACLYYTGFFFIGLCFYELAVAVIAMLAHNNLGDTSLAVGVSKWIASAAILYWLCLLAVTLFEWPGDYTVFLFFTFIHLRYYC
jgi:hypothetical protein